MINNNFKQNSLFLCILAVELPIYIDYYPQMYRPNQGNNMPSFIPRTLSGEILEMAEVYPVVTLIGPRQSGKTTLARALFPDKPYISLENPDEQRFATEDPRGFLARFPEGAVLDEIQRQPSLLSYIQGIVDNKKENGVFILTGSHQLNLQQSVTQSLAGRTAVLTLLPFSLEELESALSPQEINYYLYHGMYPKIYQDKITPTKYYRDYVHTYIERDVRQMLNIKDLNLFQNFLKLCAGRVGQIFNSHNMSNELAVSHHTIQSWISILEASFVVFRLSPYFENFGKRIIKSPKLYFTDVGVATYLLDIHKEEQIARDPLRGGLVENFIISECIKYQLNRGSPSTAYYFRDSNGNEIDCIIKVGNQLVPIEIKSSKTFNVDFLKGLKFFKSLVQDRMPSGFLIYSGDQEQSIDNLDIKNFHHIKEVFLKINEDSSLKS